MRVANGTSLGKDGAARHRLGRRRRLLVHGAALALGLLALVQCSSAPPPQPLSLEPLPNARVWPDPPEPARYAYVRTFIGEKDFVVPNGSRDTLARVARWVVGILVGEEEYLELQRPVAGLNDASGRMLVVDAAQKAVVVFDLPARRVVKWTEGARGVLFDSPVAIAEDRNGGFLVTDADRGEVFRLDGNGNPVGRFGRGILERPTGIARDAERNLVYVTDSRRHQIAVFDDAGELVSTLGRRGIERGEFNFPSFLTLHRSELYVADTLNFRIQVLDRGGDDRLAIGQLGIQVGNMSRPKGVAVGRDGRVYVVESYYDHLLVFGPKGEFLLPIGGAGQDIGQFYLPSGVWTDPGGRVYIADMFNGRVVVLKELDAGGAS